MQINSLADFLLLSKAERTKNGTWTVFVDGIHRRAKIQNCTGENEFEAKEDGYMLYCQIKDAVKGR